jgi:hypothetical protein
MVIAEKDYQSQASNMRLDAPPVNSEHLRDFGAHQISLSFLGQPRARSDEIEPPLHVMPALVAGIHVFVAAFQRERRGWPGQARP